ncbi:MAG: hypothetical protein WC593_06660 [Methanoregula sp.]
MADKDLENIDYWDDDNIKKTETFFKKAQDYSTVLLIILAAIFGIISIFTLGFKIIGVLIFSKAISTIYSDVVLGILAIYYAAWFWGVKRDIESQKNTFVMPPNSGKIPILGFSICLVLIIIFGFALFYHRDYQILLSALTVFLILNYVGWRYLKKLYHNSICESFQKYKNDNDFINYEKLKISSSWLYGKWQNKRFQTAAGSILFIFFYSIFFNNNISQIAQIDSPNVMPVVLLGGYVVGIEFWIWWHRGVRDNLLNQLSQFEKKYNFSKKF